MKPNQTISTSMAMNQATNSIDANTGSEPRPSRSEGERSEPQRVLGLGSLAHPLATPVPDPEVEAKATRRRFSAQYKLKILAQLDKCTNSNEVGALLRREGLYSSHLTLWRRQREEGLLSALTPKKRGRKQKETNPLAKEVARLERDNERLQARLKQAEIIIEVQKKVSQLLGISLAETGEKS
jgi:transposase